MNDKLETIKSLRYGVENEFEQITRQKMATAIQSVVGGEITYGGAHDAINVVAPDGRVWKAITDGSLRNGAEFVTPILGWDDLDTYQECIRAIRHAGAKTPETTSQHVHVGVADLNATQLTNLVRNWYKQEKLILKALGTLDRRLERYTRPTDHDFVERILSRKPKTLRELNEAWFGYQGSAKDVACLLETEGIRIPVWTSAKGVTHGGGFYRSQNIYDILGNPLYIGLVRHYDKTYPGEHIPIVDKSLWDSAHVILDSNLRSDGTHETRALPLRGLFKCGHCDGPMRETYSKRKGKKMYRYYLCGTDVKRNHSDCPLKRIAAEPLEELLMERVSALLSTPEALAGILTQAALLSPDSPLRRGNLPEKFVDLAQVWDFMYPIEKQKFIRTIVREVRVYVDKAVFKYNLRGLEDVVKELPDGRRGGDAITAAMESEPKPGRLVACPDGDFEETIPIRSKYDGRRTILIQPDSASLVLKPEELSPLQKAVLQGLHYSDLMETSQAKSLTELAEQLDVERTFLYHSLELVNLAPDIISAILKGEIPAELKLKNLRGNIPTSWEEQRMLYGFKKA